MSFRFLTIKLFTPISALSEIALDWVSGNWYLLDDTKEIMYLCSNDLQYCSVLIDYQISKPRSIALDPTRG